MEVNLTCHFFAVFRVYLEAIFNAINFGIIMFILRDLREGQGDRPDP